jgi:lipopolysaccharide/colanic/teichoic acid biosynthesis glycosyltransferase
MSLHFPDLIDDAKPANSVDSHARLQSFAIRRSGIYRTVIKPALDVLFVLMAAPFVVPIVLVLAALVALDGSNPFYAQKRVGKGGRIFTMWKLRSMVPQADERLEAYLDANPAARREWDSTQKLKNDPRITPIGRILRKSSLDELPQLLNVLTGDMSLVGPRPMMPDQRKLYPGQSYYALRPGITGTWQVSDRNESTFAARAKFDNAYDKSLSLSQDVGILLSTVRVVLQGTGC